MADETAKTVRKAEKLVRKGKIESAIKEYRKILASDPQNINILNRVGDLHVEIQQVDEAAKIFAQLAEYYSEEGFFPRAIALYKKILKNIPGSLIAHQRLAELYAEQQLSGDSLAHFRIVAEHWQQKEDSAQTIKIFEHMVRVAPTEPALRIDLAELYANIDQFEEAARVYRELADVLDQQGQRTEASEFRIMADSLAPPEDTPEAPPEDLATPASSDAQPSSTAQEVDDLLTEARVFAKYGLREKTRIRLEQLLAQAPEHAEAQGLLEELNSGALDHLSPAATLTSPELSRILEELERLEAEASLTSPNDPPTLEISTSPGDLTPFGRVPLETDEMPIIVSLADSDEEGSLNDFADQLDDPAMGWLDQGEEDGQFKITIGAASEEVLLQRKSAAQEVSDESQKRSRRGRELLDRAFGGRSPRSRSFGDEIPSDPTAQEYEIHFNLGMAYREMGLHEEAIKELEKAVPAPRHQVEACLSLGASLRDSGRPDEAIPWYRRGLEASDLSEIRTLDLLYNLAESFLAIEDHASAVSTFEQIEEKREDYRDVGDKLLALRGS